jgi:transcriptional regulator with XRE-family HTH domain
MDIKDFIQSKLTELGMSLSEFADELTLRGHDISKAGVYNWVIGKAKPPIHDKDFRYKLASVFRMDIEEMLKILGYVTTDDERSPFARRASDIIDHLPDDVKELALDYLVMLEKRYIEKTKV